MRPAVTSRAAALLACLLVAGCGFEQPMASGVPFTASDQTATYPAPDPAALDAWASFPAGARPRPIILGELPKVPDAGFATGDAKEAVLAGRYLLATRLPADPSATARVTLPDGPATLSTITARQALDAMSTAPAGSSGPTTRITRVELGSASFSSDRGPLPLPAWLFTVDGATGPLAWPAIAKPAFWPRQAGALVLYGGAHIAADGRTVKVVLSADSGIGCPGDQKHRDEPVLLESASAVVVGVRSVPDGVVPGTPVADCAVAAVGRNAEYTVPLASPLGGRVLLGVLGVGVTSVLAVVPG